MYNLQVTNYQMDLLKRGVETRSLHFYNIACNEKDANEREKSIAVAKDYHALWEFLVEQSDLQDKLKGGE